MNKLLIASNNTHKVNEFKEIFSNYEIISLKDINLNIDIIEDGKTFEQNAVKKALEIYKRTNIITIADDSGLQIQALNGYPGVLTKREVYKNGELVGNKKILEMMKDIKNRNASFKCIVACVINNDNILIGRGENVGTITYDIIGSNGFDFDFIFKLENGKTLSELSKETKNKISARRIAVEDLKNKLDKFFSEKNC